MSRFLSGCFGELVPYTPGEQPQERRYIKLNTNENPYPPAPAVQQALRGEGERLRLYSDPEAAELKQAAADFYGLKRENVFVGNGSDEVLAFAFLAYGRGKRLAFPDITYAFYSVFAALFGAESRVVPLGEDFTVRVEDYLTPGENVVLANPNAITGRNLELSELERILLAHPEDLLLVDEAYVDFGGQTAAALIPKYPNLLVVQTLSKSRSLAGARVGIALGQRELIADLELMKFSFNPYNVNRMSQAAAAAAFRDRAYFEECRQKIMADREYAAAGLKKLGFEVLPSLANFLLAKHEAVPGEALYRELKRRGILVRWFDEARIRDFVRITIGTREEMSELLAAVKEILGENI